MTYLTRIKNNQITDSTIYANTKIVPGTITGTLFNPNVTITSDIVIVGNLTVQGNTTYTQLSSTNTQVNDPVIVLNNGFAGSPTRDVGVLVNRGSSSNVAILWKESVDEFQLIYTTDAGTTAGNIDTASLANFRTGNIVAGTSIETLGTATLGIASATALNNTPIGNATPSTGAFTTANITTANIATLAVTGDVNVNGGDITTDLASFNLLNANATDINAFGAGTYIKLGATSGNLTLNNPTLVGTQTTQNVFNTVATTVNAFGAATTLSIGAASGSTTLNNKLVVAVADITVANTANIAPSSENLTTYANVIPGSTNTYNLGTSGTRWKDLNLAGTANVAQNLYVGGDTTIIGNLTVVGSTTAVNSNTLDVVDLNITVAKGAADSASANGAGLTVDGANAELKYVHAGTKWTMNKTLDITGALLVSSTANVGALTAASLNGTVIGNVNPTSATFTTLQTTSTANTGPLTAASINGTVIGNVDPSAATFTSLTSQGTTSLSLTSATAINNTPIGNATPSTGAFTTLTTSSTANTGALTAASINGTVIGNVVAADASFVTANATYVNAGASGVYSAGDIVGNAETALRTLIVGNVTPQTITNVVFKVEGTSSALLPAGTTAQRPSPASEGMIRFNSTNKYYEYYTGTNWDVAGPTFTIITNENFTGDGAGNVFTLGNASTTAGSIVTIDGLVKRPVDDYTISGSTLTFTAAPGFGTAVAVRKLTTTATVQTITSTSENVRFDATSDNFANIQYGAVPGNVRVSIGGDAIGGGVDYAIMNLIQTKLAFEPILYPVQPGVPEVVDYFDITRFQSAKYIVTANFDGNVESTEALVVASSSNAFMTVYGTVNSGLSLGNIAVDVTGSNVELTYTVGGSVGSNVNVKVSSTYIKRAS